MQAGGPPVLNVHTPVSSFAIIHSLTQESLDELYDKLARKGLGSTSTTGGIGPGWLKYEYNGSVWNLDDESDYAIFAWRQHEANALHQEPNPTGTSTDTALSGTTATGTLAPDPGPSVASSSRVMLPETRSALMGGSSPIHPSSIHTSIHPTLHLHNPAEPLPEPPAYCNPSYYLFQPHHEPVGRPNSRMGSASKTSKKKKGSGGQEKPFVPKLKKDFEKFHSENGVRTVMGSIGPVENVRMLLKSGHRHVYMSRKFATRHGFIPPDSAPGNYGYGGLVSIGEWPITLTPSASSGQAPPPVIHTSSNCTDATHQLQGFKREAGYVRPDAFNMGSGGTGGGAGQSISTALHGAPHRRSLSHSPYSSHRSLGTEGAGSGGNNLLAPLPALQSTTTLIGGGSGTHLHPSNRSVHTTHTSYSVNTTRSGGPLPNPTPPSKLTKSQRAQTAAHLATAPNNGLKPVMLEVWLSEEPHFDVVLGRSFFEKRGVKVSTVDPTEVWCLDTGEKVECEVVILKDGRGEIVTVT